MIILFIITILLLIVQISLALIGFNATDKLKKKYSKPLGSQITPEKMLSQNEKKFSKVTIKVSENLDDVASLQDQLVLINKSDLSKNTLYINYKFLYYFYLALNKNRYIRDYKIYQNVIFGVQIFFLVLGSIFFGLIVNTYLIASLVLQLFLFVFCIYNYFRVSTFAEEVFTTNKKILDLDKVEEARIESLIADISLMPFEYPFEFVFKFAQFIKP